jgi:S-adenosylmethionine:tRNA ribosyltransferase-isomerase
MFATITHAAGISSTGDDGLDALLPLDEAYDIPATTASLIHSTRSLGGRVIAIGTTVVRALEDAAARHGDIRPGTSMATLRLGPLTPLRVVDALVTGQHEPGTSHYELLRAFQDDEVLRFADHEANARGYRTHEFGDSLFIARACPAERRLADCYFNRAAIAAMPALAQASSLSCPGAPLTPSEPTT